MIPGHSFSEKKLIVVIFLILTLCMEVFSADIDNTVKSGNKKEGVVEKASPGWGHKILFYIPNRLLDICDIVRARVRVGPGLSYSLSFTKRASFFIGDYNTVYAGLPGPRTPHKFVSPIGREKQKGIIIMGIDATDDTPYPPKHSVTECQIGGQLLIVGADAGIDFWEIADFFSGLVMIDLRKDDI